MRRFLPLAATLSLALSPLTACENTSSATPEPDGSRGTDIGDIGGGADADGGSTTDTGMDTAKPDKPAHCPAVSGLRPDRLSEHSGIYDPIKHRVVVHGGSTAVPVDCDYAVSTFEQKTWFYDIECDYWTQAEGGLPFGRTRHGGAYDSTDHRMFIFGGRWRAGTKGDYTPLSDMWVLDLTTDTWSEVMPANAGPAARYNMVMEYDKKRHRLIVFSGNTSRSNFTYIANNDVWTLDLATLTWTELTTSIKKPRRRFFSAALYDEARDQLVIFGGADEGLFFPAAQFMNDLWALDFGQDPPLWTLLASKNQKPDGRYWASMVQATDLDTYILFGGHDDMQLANRNDLYRFDPTTDIWSTIHIADTYNVPGPDAPKPKFCKPPADFSNVDMLSPERRNAAVFVSSGSYAYLTGGKTDCGVIDDMVGLDLVTGVWTELMTSTVGESCIRKGGIGCNGLCF